MGQNFAGCLIISWPISPNVWCFECRMNQIFSIVTYKPIIWPSCTFKMQVYRLQNTLPLIKYQVHNLWANSIANLCLSLSRLCIWAHLRTAGPWHYVSAISNQYTYVFMWQVFLALTSRNVYISFICQRTCYIDATLLLSKQLWFKMQNHVQIAMKKKIRRFQVKFWVLPSK